LVFAARRFIADPMLFVAAVRSDERTPLLSAGLPTLTVEGLDAAATAGLLAAARSTQDRWRSTEEALWLQQATGGNPLAILELTRDPSRLTPGIQPGASGPLPVPATLAEHFVQRAESAGPSVPRLLRCVKQRTGRHESSSMRRPLSASNYARSPMPKRPGFCKWVRSESSSPTRSWARPHTRS
jgi:hypothetical protein